VIAGKNGGIPDVTTYPQALTISRLRFAYRYHNHMTIRHRPTGSLGPVGVNDKGRRDNCDRQRRQRRTATRAILHLPQLGFSSFDRLDNLKSCRRHNGAGQVSTDKPECTRLAAIDVTRVIISTEHLQPGSIGGADDCAFRQW
jgi:hypothetical protein